MGLDLSDSVEDIGMIGVDLGEVLTKKLIVFIEPAIEEWEVVRKFGFWDGDDVDEFELVFGDSDGHCWEIKKDVYKCSMDGRIINLGWKFYKSTVIYARELLVLLEFISHVSCFCFLFENAYKFFKEIT